LNLHVFPAACSCQAYRAAGRLRTPPCRDVLLPAEPWPAARLVARACCAGVRLEKRRAHPGGTCYRRAGTVPTPCPHRAHASHARGNPPRADATCLVPLSLCACTQPCAAVKITTSAKAAAAAAKATAKAEACGGCAASASAAQRLRPLAVPPPAYGSRKRHWQSRSAARLLVCRCRWCSGRRTSSGSLQARGSAAARAARAQRGGGGTRGGGAAGAGEGSGQACTERSPSAAWRFSR
jgi:hypothetical protein